MARTWLSVTVELLGGRGSELWPWPGRVLMVGPAHTFQQLADAINTAFARWDPSHLSMFTLADGRLVTDEETGAELAEASDGPGTSALDIGTARVVQHVELGAEFQYTFDFGDEWTHRCTVGQDKVDPVEALGVRPDRPVPYWGWGVIPDQYGRRWADDDGENPTPRRPSATHPMLLHAWPHQQRVRPLDLAELRVAITSRDVDRLLAVVNEADIDAVLQQVGSALAALPDSAGEHADSLAASVINRLTRRDWEGDDALAENLLARLRGEPALGRVVAVDLEMLSTLMEGDASMSTGGFLDLHTGQVYDDAATDPTMVGEDLAIDVEDDPDRWLRFDRIGSRDGWRDMAAFAERQRDEALQHKLHRAIEGKGAFRRFRDVVHAENLAETWYAFSTDRQLGRARAYLAAEGIRARQG